MDVHLAAIGSLYEATFSKKQYNKNADRVHVSYNHSFWLAVLQGEAGRDTADKR